MKKDNISEAAMLRQKAEEILKKNSSKSALHLSEAEAMKLIHELEVHQIELEMQNAELELAISLKIREGIISNSYRLNNNTTSN